MKDLKLHLLLADDDLDDCEFFQDALKYIDHPVNLSVVNNGVELMDFLLSERAVHPDVLFLDLNMPKKSGLQCLAEIKSSDTLSHIPIIIFSTSLDKTVVKDMFNLGANHYIQKPGQFSSLKMVLKKAITLFSDENETPRSMDSFVIQP